MSHLCGKRANPCGYNKNEDTRTHLRLPANFQYSPRLCLRCADLCCSISLEKATQIPSPLLLPTSQVTLRCVTGLKHSVTGLPSRFLSVSVPTVCLLRLSFPPSSLRQLRHWWVPRVVWRSYDVMTHDRRSARSRHSRSRCQMKRCLLLIKHITLLTLHPVNL